MRWLFFMAFILWTLGLAAQAVGKIKLWTSASETVRLGEVQQGQPVVLAFLSPSCPICQKYAGMLRELPQRYPGVNVAGVFTKWESWEEIRRYAAEYELPFTLLLDKKHQLLRTLKATVTPEVFLMDAQGRIHYRGAIDNWFFDLGKPRAKVTENYLTDALDCFLKGTEIAVKITKPVGCVIAY